MKLLQEKDIVRSEPVTLASGQRSDFYIDVKKAYGYPELLRLASEGVWMLMSDRTTCVAAIGFGGAPLATAISLSHNLRLTMIRDEPKKHGKRNLLDGHVPDRNDKVSIVDDVLTTGLNLKKAVEALLPTGAEILGCSVVVRRSDGSASGIGQVTHLITADEIMASKK